MLPVLFGFAGTKLTAEEREFFRAFPPLGYHLFRRNIETPEQIKALVASLNELHQTESLPIFIDQEGGRVQRLRPPHWVDMPSFRDIGNLYMQDQVAGESAARLHTKILCGMLTELGITGDYAPVLDVPVAGADDVIGNRAFSEQPDIVAQLGTIVTDEFLQNGIIPTIKHIPGHGRAETDSHYACPVVTTNRETLEQTDFVPFKEVAQHVGAKNIWAMTAHVVFTALDNQPVSVSKKAIDFLRHDLGITGPIIPDAIEMEALGGTLPERALATLAAGCDAVLHCSGKLDDMKDIAKVLPPITNEAKKRFSEAQARHFDRKSQENWRDLYKNLQELLSIQSADSYKAHEALTSA